MLLTQQTILNPPFRSFTSLMFVFQLSDLGTSVRRKFKVEQKSLLLPSPLYKRTNKEIDGRSIETAFLVYSDSDTQSNFARESRVCDVTFGLTGGAVVFRGYERTISNIII